MKVKVFVFALCMVVAYPQDATDVQAALQRARDNQTPSPASPSTLPKQEVPQRKESNPATPNLRSYRPGISKLYQISDLVGLQGKGHLVDSWIYGKFTVLQGGPLSHQIIGAVPAGAMTGSNFAALLGVSYKPSIFQIGWLFNDNRMPPLPEKTVIVILASAPATLEKVDLYQGHIAVAMNMVNPPNIEK